MPCLLGFCLGVLACAWIAFVHSTAGGYVGYLYEGMYSLGPLLGAFFGYGVARYVQD